MKQEWLICQPLGKVLLSGRSYHYPVSLTTGAPLNWENKSNSMRRIYLKIFRHCEEGHNPTKQSPIP